MKSDFLLAITQLSAEKNLPKEVVLEAVEAALVSAYRKNEQSYIESFNRTVRKECLGWQNYRLKDLPECQKMVELFLERYHYHRPHMGLRMRTPLRKEDDCRISTETLRGGRKYYK